MSRQSSARTLGPLSIARPEPSNMRPSMSSETPSFRLEPVNSTFVQLSVSDVFTFRSAWTAIPSSRRFQLSLQRPIVISHISAELQLYSNTCTTARFPSPCKHMPYLPLNITAAYAPLASSTCPDLSVPSGSVKVTISLYRGNLTCDMTG